MTLKLLVFDWDGTLADSVGKIIECKQTLSTKHNLPTPTDQTVKQVLGMDFDTAIRRCFPTADDQQFASIKKQYEEIMLDPNFDPPLFAQTQAVLTELKKQNFKLAIATAKNKAELLRSRAYQSVADFFDLACSSSEFDRGKPNPTMLQHIYTELAALPSECLMVGDTTTDIEFSHNANVPAVAVTYGAHTIEKLKAVKPTWMIDELTQLIQIAKTEE